MASSLDPVLVAVYPRWSEAVDVVRKTCARTPRPLFAVALAESEEQVASFREGWHEDGSPLLLLRCDRGGSAMCGVEAVTEIARHYSQRPVAVLLADGPNVVGFREGRRREWNRTFARDLAKHLLDVQVFEYVPDWEANPPRIR